MRKHVDGSPLTVQQLSTLIALAKWKKQSAVENALGKSQSQISRDLAGMEKALGGRSLFCRTTRTITEEGEKVLEYALAVKHEWDNLKYQLEEEKLSGKVSILIDADFMGGGGYSSIAEIEHRLPDIKFHCKCETSGSIITSLAAGDCDLAILCDTANRRGLSHRPLYAGKAMLALPKSSKLASKDKIGGKDLKGVRLFMSTTSAEATNLMGVDKLRHLKKSIEFIPGGREAVISSVASGFGLGLVITFQCFNDKLLSRLSDEIILKEIDSPRANISYVCAIRSGMKTNKLINAVLRSLLRIAKK
ncbi:MAG: LysR family transcriptional regulator [Planctomycetes bacterium]|nr:LysR family transcriptional regulator [Planctomycetota bacterium]